MGSGDVTAKGGAMRVVINVTTSQLENLLDQLQKACPNDDITVRVHGEEERLATSRESVSASTARREGENMINGGALVEKRREEVRGQVPTPKEYVVFEQFTATGTRELGRIVLEGSSLRAEGSDVSERILNQQIRKWRPERDGSRYLTKTDGRRFLEALPYIYRSDDCYATLVKERE